MLDHKFSSKNRWLIIATTFLTAILVLMFQVYAILNENRNNPPITSSSPGTTLDNSPSPTVPDFTNTPDQTLIPTPTIKPQIDYSALEDLDRTGKRWSFGHYQMESDGKGGRVKVKDSFGVEQLVYELESGAASLVKKYGGITGHSDKKTVYLTFDEGYENGYSGKILDTLKEKNVKAIFFLTGVFIESNPELVQRMYNEGHLIGNHTENHLKMPDQSNENFSAELNKLEKRVQEILGEDYNTTYYRPPEGWLSERDLALAHQMGYKPTFWSFAYGDYTDVDNGTEEHKQYAYRRITQSLHNGEVLLLHAVFRTNAEILGDVIDYIRAQGYTISRIDKI